MSVKDTDQEILTTAHQWMTEGYEVLMVTVLKTWGSSPRPPGSLMLMRSDGMLAGSVSGGCVEEDLLERYTGKQLSESFPTQVNYGVNREEASRFGLPCGGRLELLIERLDDINHIESILAAMKSSSLVARHTDLQTGKVTIEPARAEQDFIHTNIYVRKVFGPQWNMLLIGAGHLSQYVSQVAMMLGYRVIVCDPREEYAKGWQVEGTELTTLMPDDAVTKYTGQARSVVIALTHDPKLDDMALLEALQSDSFYVGAIGSLRNCEQRRERLKQMGISQSELQRLHAPVGLSIGSHTPPEIAISILAEITQLRNVEYPQQLKYPEQRNTISLV